MAERLSELQDEASAAVAGATLMAATPVATANAKWRNPVVFMHEPVAVVWR